MAGVDGDHLTAHGVFIHLALFVVGIAGSGALRYVMREHAAINLPVKKIRAGVAAPQSAVTIKYRDARAQGEDGISELLAGGRGLGFQMAVPARSFSKSSGVSTLAATSGSLTAR